MLPVRDFAGITTIYGATGTGKTQMTASLLNQLSTSKDYNIGYTVFDFEGEYTRLLDGDVHVLRLNGNGSNKLGINLAPTSSLDHRIRASRLQEFLKYIVALQGAELSPSMMKLLDKTAETIINKGVSLSEIDSILESVAYRTGASDKTVYALSSRLHILTRYPLSEILDGPDTVSFREDESYRKVIVDLHDVAMIDLRSASITVILGALSILLNALQWTINNAIKHFIVIDEAEKTLSNDHPAGLLPELLGYQMRKRGISSIIVAHSPYMLHSVVRREASTIISFRQIDKNDADYLKNAMNLADPQILSGLDKGQAVVKSPSIGKPVIVTVSLHRPLGGLEKLILDSLETRPCLSIRERRTLLRVSGTRFRDALSNLKAANLVEEKSLNLGSGRPIKLLQKPGTNPSVVHECMVKYIIERILAPVGIDAVKKDSPDIEVAIGDKRIAIEVETGSNINSIKYNILLESGYDYIIIVCTSKRPCMKRAIQATQYMNAYVLYSGNISRLRRIIVQELNTPSGDSTPGGGLSSES